VSCIRWRFLLIRAPTSYLNDKISVLRLDLLIAVQLKFVYRKCLEIFRCWFLIKTQGSGRSGFYQDYGLYSRVGFIDFGMNICAGYNQRWLVFEGWF